MVRAAKNMKRVETGGDEALLEQVVELLDGLADGASGQGMRVSDFRVWLDGPQVVLTCRVIYEEVSLRVENDGRPGRLRLVPSSDNDHDHDSHGHRYAHRIAAQCWKDIVQGASSVSNQETLWREMLGYLRILPWERVLELVDGLSLQAQTVLGCCCSSKGAEPENDVRVWWMVDTDRHSSSVVTAIRPALARRGKRGTFLTPKPVSFRQMEHQRHLVREDTDKEIWDFVYAALRHAHEEYQRGFWCNRVPPSHYFLSSALRHLVGHPRVRWSGGSVDPVAVRVARVGVQARKSHGTIQFGLTLAGKSVSGDGGAKLVEGLRYLLHNGPTVGLLMDGQLCLLDAPREVVLMAAALIRPQSVLPVEALEALQRRLPNWSNALDVAVVGELKGAQLESRPRFVARLEPKGRGLRVSIRAQLDRSAPLHPPGCGPREIWALDAAGQPCTLVRDLEEEGRLARQWVRPLMPENFEPGWDGEVLDQQRALDLIERLREAKNVETQWPRGERWVLEGGVFAENLKVRVKSRHKWFGVRGSVAVSEKDVGLAALMEAVRKNQRYISVGDNRWAKIEESLRNRLQRLDRVTLQKNEELLLPPQAGDSLIALLSDANETELCEQWRRWEERLKQSRAWDPEVPNTVRAVLRPYQLDGFPWLAQMAHWGPGACLADDMGLGKTLQTLAALALRQREGPALVVAPTSVCINWLREIARFTPGLQAIHFAGKEREALLAEMGPGSVVVASYGVLTRDVEALSTHRFATLVLDEAQAVKNAASRRAKAVRALSADWTLALTGTPVENHVGELWSLFRILNPELLGSWKEFRTRFAKPIAEGNSAAVEVLSEIIRPFVLRRTKREVATELPPRTDVQIDVVLSEAERALYDDARVTALAALRKRSKQLTPEQRRIKVLGALMRLRQLCCHPKLVHPESQVPSSKLARVLGVIEQLLCEDRRCLVFSQFTRHLGFLRQALGERGVPFLYLDGGTPAEVRGELIDRFQGGREPVFLISLKAGGVGLNLTAADNVLHLDPWWNPAVEDQATDRAHRIGQRLPVNVYRFVTTDTVESIILQMHADKRHLASGLLAGTDTPANVDVEALVAMMAHGVEAG